MLQEVLFDTIHDTLPMLPVLFLTYLFLEYIERKELHSQRISLSLKRFGPLCGALLGIIPQCGFSLIATSLYVDHTITMGTLIAVFISTSDEAIPILLAYPSQISALGYVIIVKVLLALLVGYLTDLFFMRYHRSKIPVVDPNISCACAHHNHSFWQDVLLRTGKIFSFVFIVSFLLSVVIQLIGSQRLSSLLLEQSLFQPFIAAWIGLIPNCAASVLLTQLFVNGVLSFGSLISGLISNAGLGLMVLFRLHANKKEVLFILLILLISAISCGTGLQLLFS